jgi:2-amino-4-hydroxy-6-hydroxymethyldihydropteridine diphosphokinase
VHDENVYLGLGSNVGNRRAHLRAALADLQERGLRLCAVSSFYLTEPDLRVAPPDGDQTPTPRDRGHADQRAGHPWYVNCVASFERAPAPRALLELCRDVEREHGREHRDPAPQAIGPQPRTLDIDLLLVGARIIDEPGLKVPHPRMTQRRFVLQPLAEIAPRIRHPLTGISVEDLLAALPQREAISMLEPAASEVL